MSLLGYGTLLSGWDDQRMCDEYFQVPLKLFQNLLLSEMPHRIFPGCATKSKTQVTIVNQP